MSDTQDITLERRVKLLERDSERLDSHSIPNKIIEWSSLILAFCYSAWRVVRIAEKSPDVIFSPGLMMFFETDTFEYLVLGSLFGWVFIYYYVISNVLKGLFNVFFLIRSAIYD